MPFKSKAQRRKFAELLVKGEISPETFEEWSRETGVAKLPERAPRTSKRKRADTRKRGVTRKKSAPARKRLRSASKRSTRKSTRKSKK